jgi:hypothetical protein
MAHGTRVATIGGKREDERQMCFLLSIMLLGPRVGIILYWIGWPARWEIAFDTFIVPFIGFLIAPWTTLTYVLCAPDGVTGLDYLWIGLALLLDVASLSGGGVYGRSRRTQTTFT